MKWLSIIIFTLISVFSYADETALSLVTEDYPPYAYEENGQIKGIAVEIVSALVKEAKINASTDIYPFARAFHNATTKADTGIFPLIKLPEREKLLIWGSELFPINAYVYTLKSRSEIKVNSVADLHKLANGAILNAADHIYLKELGVKNIQTVVKLEQNLQKMLLGRIDTVIMPEVCFNFIVKKMKLDKNKFHKALKVKRLSTSAYLAFNKQTDQQIIDRLNGAFKVIKENGIYKKIIDRYYK